MAIFREYIVIDHRLPNPTAERVENVPSFMSAALSVFGDQITVVPSESSVHLVFVPGTMDLIGTVERLTYTRG